MGDGGTPKNTRKGNAKMRKHRYTEEEAPMNTGSIKRPARFNLRLDCQTRARTHKLFCEARVLLGLPKDYTFADIWQTHFLVALEHILWHMKESPTAMRGMMRTLFERLPREDWVRNRYAELKARLEPPRVVQDRLAI